MTIYTHSCGHTVESAVDNATRRAKIAAQPCNSCRIAQAEQDAAATIAQIELPALAGSERQVAWAEKLRRDALELLTAGDALVEAYRQSTGRANPTEVRAAIDAEIARVFSETRAAWWIESRDKRRWSW